MIELSITSEKAVELQRYSDDATLFDLGERINAIFESLRPEESPCAGCAACCRDPISLNGHDLEKLRDGEMVPGEDSSGRFHAAGNCIILPDPPDVEKRRHAVKEMSRQHGFDDSVAVQLYEYNAAEPVQLAKKEDGTCIFLSESGLCGVYDRRPLICRLYVCNAGERLSALLDTVAGQSAWHAYAYQGWIPRPEIDHNPFFHYPEGGAALVSDFDHDLSGAIGQLFCFF